mgnify:CR=1 FL=1
MIGISEELTVIRPGGALSPRCAGVLEAALAGRQAEVLSRLEGPLTGRRLLFVVSLDEGGVNRGFYDLLAHLRTHPNCLDRCVGSVLVDAPGDLYTKAAGRDLVLAANLAGCAFVGRPLVEGTGDLRNFTVQARNAGCSLEAAYHLATADLVERVLAFSRPRLEELLSRLDGWEKPAPIRHVLALHASQRATSNTLALWGLVRTRLEERCDITEICLRNGTLEDCAGCPYTTCLHFGEQGGCFYGGVMVQEVYPAIREADAVVLLCPNYNDALSANLTACVNRLTALFRQQRFYDKALFAIVVSGYSGGDIVARQLIDGLNMNKSFYLPARFAMIETANDPGEALSLPGVQERVDDFAARVKKTLLHGAE